MRLVAVDQGTTSTRSLVVDASGHAQIAASVTHKQYYPHNGWVEHDPDELLKAIKTCLSAAGQVDAIGLANQGESCLAWDARNKRPICPVIVWQDNRTASEIEKLKAEGAESLVQSISGLPLDSYFSASKLGWIIREIPAARQLAASGHLRLGTTDAYFRDVLTDQFATDPSTASRTALLNLETGQWDESLCQLFEVPINCLPEIQPTTGELGICDLSGQSTPLAASVVDQQAALYGHGCRAAGDGKITFGTGAFALMLTGEKPQLPPNSGLLPTIAWQHHDAAPVYALEGGVYTASAVISWLERIGVIEDLAALSQFAGESPMRRGTVFVPALAGLACPYWRRDVRGSWLGLTLDTSRDDLIRVALEGVACRSAQVLSAISQSGVALNQLGMDGGLAANTWFQQLMADVTQQTIKVPNLAELTAAGVLALIADAMNTPLTITQKTHQVSPKQDQSDLIGILEQAIALTSQWPTSSTS
ncbi:glycerol kinase [Spiribacter sp. C176]|uniref:Glycerol kinase n=1 Tax=Spiribacter salilacus TaxID=2664894 RepID=A0A6N7QME4_9GAMM|nr:FGGY family carbohydrate kinase [Spiribacter salilacus]MRH77685.1 glycerol kinase [Spiribacter salilacus]